MNCLQNHLYVARLGNYFFFQIGLPLAGTLDRFLAEILRLHFLRKTRRMGAFSVLNFYCWCVLYGERNKCVIFSIFVDGRRSIWCSFRVASVHIHAGGTVICEVFCVLLYWLFLWRVVHCNRVFGHACLHPYASLPLCSCCLTLATTAVLSNRFFCFSICPANYVFQVPSLCYQDWQPFSHYFD